MIHVDPNWWKTLFDEVYLITDAPFVCNPVVTKHEVDVIEQALKPRPEASILDLCGGQGRHALELARRGYHQPTVLDYSAFLLQCGRRDAADSGLDVTFCQGDARDTGLPAASFDIVLLMASSFGYFVDANDDRRVLSEAARVLRSGGRFLLDLIDREAALRRFCPESWHEATEDIVICWQREVADNVIHVREMVLSKISGLLRDRAYAERLYSPEDLHQLLSMEGFQDITVQTGAFVHHPDDEHDYGLATDRMLVMATKP